MDCPNCGSARIRKASAVYEAGTRTSTRRTRGTALGIGFGRRRSLGAGVFSSRSSGRSSSLAAQRADKARIVWWGLPATFALFVILSITFVVVKLSDPFGTALMIALGVMIGCPLVTGVLAVFANRDYGRRWYCGSCGAFWTED